uniref:NAD-dependent epimerase/dehydratase domain-containing protein n=1 Tax=viral metagenome TaxID=1070528 RepID=A0A6C0ESF6_9ZZZZ
MSKSEILIFGANGWIGSKVYNLLKQRNITVHKAYSRGDNLSDIENEIYSIKDLTHVMSFIGRTHGTYENQKIGTIDYLEKPGKLVENIKDNLFSPIQLAEICKKNNIHFTYLGTGCIFDYDNEHTLGDLSNGFKDTDLPNFFGSSYSTVKGYTDRLMQLLYNDTCLNLRIRMPITDEVNERNFITKITNYTKICSLPNSMTVLDELLPILIDFALEKKVGTYNFTNPGLITHNEILKMYKEIVDPAFTWNNFTITEQNEILASKRSNNFLDTSKLENDINDINNSISNINTSVRNCLLRMKENIEKSSSKN